MTPTSRKASANKESDNARIKGQDINTARGRQQVKDIDSS